MEIFRVKTQIARNGINAAISGTVIVVGDIVRLFGTNGKEIVAFKAKAAMPIKKWYADKHSVILKVESEGKPINWSFTLRDGLPISPLSTVTYSDADGRQHVTWGPLGIARIRAQRREALLAALETARHWVA